MAEREDLTRRVYEDVRPASRSIAGSVRENRIPLALIGAGLGWLLVDRVSGRDRNHRTIDSWQEDPWQSGSGQAWTQDDVRAFDDEGAAGEDGSGRSGTAAGERLTGAGERVREATRTAKEGISRRASGISERVSDGTHEIASRAAAAGNQVRSAARTRAGIARRRARRSMDGSPLVAGALMFAAGLLGGLVIPASRWEDRMIGETSDSLKRDARGAVGDARRKAKSVVRDTTKAVRREAVQGLQSAGRDLSSNMAREIRHAARESIQRDELR